MSAARFTIAPTPLQGLSVLTRQPRADERGSFQRMYCAETFAALGLSRPFVHINLSTTPLAGAVRGLHFQYPPHAELKVLSCTRGKIFDVAVDIRQGSPTFLKWHAEILSAENCRSLVVPEGFAHGFQVLEAESDVLYFNTAPYAPDAQGGLRPDDPALGIAWPLPLRQISAQDASWPPLPVDFKGIRLP